MCHRLSQPHNTFEITNHDQFLDEAGGGEVVAYSPVRPRSLSTCLDTFDFAGLTLGLFVLAKIEIRLV